MVDPRETTGSWLHTIGVGCALVAGFDALITIAAADQERPRILALLLAFVSAIVLLVGWSRFKWMERLDAVAMIGLDAWVLADVGW